MVDIETFLTYLYVLVDDFCKIHPLPPRPGPAWKLSPSEAITLALFAQWSRFRSERDFYRFARQRLLHLFPNLPDRSQLNRQWRALHDIICFLSHHLAWLLGSDEEAYEAIDTLPIVVRNAKRRGRGWLAGQAEIGWSNRLGWFMGCKALIAATPTGVITGWEVAPANVEEHSLAENFFALRSFPHPRCPFVGRSPYGRYYPADKGFIGREWHQRWRELYGAIVICPTRRDSRHSWPKPLRRWLAGLRQIVETAVEKLLYAFRLDRERPHQIDGLLTRLAAKAALHNFCIWLNRQLGRPDLAFADLLGWI